MRRRDFIVSLIIGDAASASPLGARAPAPDFERRWPAPIRSSS